VVRVFHESNEFGFFDLVKGLVASHDPLHEESIKCRLIKVSLQ
jgi:hypothetical protein